MLRCVYVCVYMFVCVYIHIYKHIYKYMCMYTQTHRIFITELFIKMSNKLLYIYAIENNTASYSKG